MSLASTTYTLGAVALVVLMAMRPPVEPGAQQATLDEAVTAPVDATDKATDAPVTNAADKTTDASPAYTADKTTDNPAADAADKASDVPAADTADKATDTPAAAPADTDPAPADENKPATEDKSGAIGQPDYAREQRLASEISDTILDGEVIQLKASGHEFMALQTNVEAAHRAVVIAHGRGYHPDWVDVANPLRVGLTAAGWTTLSLQMPVLAKDAKYNDYVPLFTKPAQGLLLA